MERTDNPLEYPLLCINLWGHLVMAGSMPLVRTTFPQRQLILVTVRQSSQTGLGLG